MDFSIQRVFGFPAIPGILLAACLAVSVFLGYNIDRNWYLGVLAAAPLTAWLVAAVRSKRRRLLTGRVRSLRKNGRSTPLGHEDYSGYFRRAAGGDGASVTDDRTCLDLNIEEIFTLLDRTVTIPGANMLYTMLRSPLFDTGRLKRRRETVDIMAENAESSEALQVELGNLLHPGYDEVTPLLLYGPAELPPSRLMSIVGTGAAVLSVTALFFIHAPWTFLLPLGAFILNMIIYYRHYGPITRQIGALAYIGNLVGAAGKLAGNAFLNSLDPDIGSGLKKTVPELKAIQRQVRRIINFSPDSRDILSMLIAYVKIFFLVDIHAYRKFIGLVEERREKVLGVYELTGKVDALLSVAVFISGKKNLASPVLAGETRSIRAVDMYHPLLEDPVANSFSVDPPGCIVTGSNMAGKSTFLRTVALNTLLAQTLCFCFAGEWEAGLFFPATSIEKHDSIALGKSLYYDEAKRIYDIIESTDSRVPVLCVIDELLSGTNSTERRKASVAILGYLARKGSLVVSATHDLQTAALLADLYDNRHFADRLDEGGLDFDYRIKPGILSTCNAIDLLERIGYPAEVVARARSAR